MDFCEGDEVGLAFEVVAEQRGALLGIGDRGPGTGGGAAAADAVRRGAGGGGRGRRGRRPPHPGPLPHGGEGGRRRRRRSRRRPLTLPSPPRGEGGRRVGQGDGVEVVRAGHGPTLRRRRAASRVGRGRARCLRAREGAINQIRYDKAMVQHFNAECVDRLTGRTFLLRLMGLDEDEACDSASAWGFITSMPVATRPESMQTVPNTMQIRGGRSVPMSMVSASSAGSDIDEMLTVRNQQSHPVSRHFFLQNLAEVTYSARNDRPDALQWCEWACWQWLLEAPVLLPALRTEVSDLPTFVHVSVPKRLIILLEKSGEPSRAAEVAKACMQFGLNDQDVEYLALKSKKLERMAQ